MHKTERDGKWKNDLKVTSNSWTHDHKMQSGQVVKSKLRMTMVIEISQRTTLNLTKYVWDFVYTQAPHVTNTS